MATNPFLQAFKSKQKTGDTDEDKKTFAAAAKGNPFLEPLVARDEMLASEKAAREEQAAKKIAAFEVKKKEEESKNRNPFAKLWDQVNVLDSGKSWKTATPSAEQANKSLATQAKELGSGFFSGVEKVGDSVEALTGITERRMNHWDQQLREGKIDRKQYQKLLENQQKDIAFAGTEDKGMLDRLKTSAGVALEATSEIVPWMKAGKAAQLTTKGGAAFGALTGASHGVGSEMSNPEGFDWKRAAIETAVGTVAGAGGGKLAQWTASKKAVQEAAKETALINGQMDEAASSFLRQAEIPLPDGSPSRVSKLAEIDDKISKLKSSTMDAEELSSKASNSFLNDSASKLDKPNRLQGKGFSYDEAVTGKAQNGKYLKDRIVMGVDDKGNTIVKDGRHLLEAYREKGLPIPSDKVKYEGGNAVDKLLAERQKLVDEISNIKDPAVRTAEGINLVDTDLERAVKAGDTKAVERLTKQQEYMQTQALAVDRDEAITAQMTLGNGRAKVSRLGQRTEAKAIEEKLATGFDNLPTYQTTNLADEAATVVNHMNVDMEGATRIALGLEPPTPGTTAGSYYVGLVNRAAKEGDAELIRRLATESSVASKASRMGQEISALQNLDPESPVTAVKNVLKAREKGQPKLPATISIEETQRITELSKTLAQAKEAAMSGGDKMAYGNARVAYDNYVEDLVRNSGPTIKEAIKRNPAQFAKDAVLNAAGLTKSAVATLDNSVIGRQGWKTLMTSPKTWAKNSLKSFQDIAQTFKGKEVLDYVHADVISRDNALNGMYKAMGLDVYGTKKNFLEEAFPVSFDKMGKTRAGKQVAKPFKASEVAFTGWQQRTRADLADQYLTLAKNMGVDLTSKKELEAIGKMVNSLTGRGDLGKTLEKSADGLNKLFFAPRLVKSHIDVLGGQAITGAGGSNFVRKQAAKNLVKIAVGSAMALKLASAATGGKIETDPRSSNFGKLQVGDTRFDLSGGMAGLLTLGSRLITQESKSSTTGELKKLNTGEFGSQNTYDVLLAFGENKLSPLARSATDFLKGEDFDGNKPTPGSVVKNLTVPLILRQFEEVKDSKNSANPIATLIADGLGIGANTYNGLESNWNANNSKRVTEFKSKVSTDSFKKANDLYNSQFQDWYGSVSQDDRFWKLPIKQRETLVNGKKDSLTKEVMMTYGYKYEAPKKTESEEATYDELKKYYK